MSTQIGHINIHDLCTISPPLPVGSMWVVVVDSKLLVLEKLAVGLEVLCKSPFHIALAVQLYIAPAVLQVDIAPAVLLFYIVPAVQPVYIAPAVLPYDIAPAVLPLYKLVDVVHIAGLMVLVCVDIGMQLIQLVPPGRSVPIGKLNLRIFQKKFIMHSTFRPPSALAKKKKYRERPLLTVSSNNFWDTFLRLIL